MLLNKESLERMEGLVNQPGKRKLSDAIGEVTFSLLTEGFEIDEIQTYLDHIVTARTRAIIKGLR